MLQIKQFFLDKKALSAMFPKRQIKLSTKFKFAF